MMEKLLVVVLISFAPLTFAKTLISRFDTIICSDSLAASEYILRVTGTDSDRDAGGNPVYKHHGMVITQGISGERFIYEDVNFVEMDEDHKEGSSYYIRDQEGDFSFSIIFIGDDLEKAYFRATSESHRVSCKIIKSL
jgi:hypothetical protein